MAGGPLPATSNCPAFNSGDDQPPIKFLELPKVPYRGRQIEAASFPFRRRARCPERIHIPPLDSLSVELSAVMNNPDQDTLIRAVEDARRILGEYIEGPRDVTRTVEHLLAVLDRNDVVHALDRMKRRRVIRLIE